MIDEYMIKNIISILENHKDWREIRISRLRNPNHDNDTWEMEYITDYSLENFDEEDKYCLMAWGETKKIEKNS